MSLCVKNVPLQENSKRETIKKLSDISKNVIITGIPDGSVMHTATCSSGNKINTITIPHKKGPFYGSGDLFASAFIGMYINGDTLERAASLACDFVSDCIEKTLDEREKYWYGLKFEQSLGKLAEKCKEYGL